MVHGPVINQDTCIRCNNCYERCPMDVYAASLQEGDTLIVRYPDECWYCASCVLVCPVVPPAIRLVHPLNMRLALKKVV